MHRQEQEKTKELSALRKRMDEINREMQTLFEERMDVSVDIAHWKKANGIPVRDIAREEEILDSMRALSKRYPAETRTLFETLFALSRGLQERENESER